MKVTIILMLIAMMTIVHCEVQDATDKDFDAIIKEHPRVLVMFSAAWCSHCKKMIKYLRKLDKAVQESKEEEARIKIIRIDADINKVVGNRPEYKIRGYPTFKYFDKGVMHKFSG